MPSAPIKPAVATPVLPAAPRDLAPAVSPGATGPTDNSAAPADGDTFVRAESKIAPEPQGTSDSGPVTSVAAARELLGLPAHEVTWEGPRRAGPRKSWHRMLTWKYPIVGDPKENHWAVGGANDLYDKFNGSVSRAYQRQQRSRSWFEALAAVAKLFRGKWDAWNAGHCNQEAMASMFAEPERPVWRPVKDGLLPAGVQKKLHGIADKLPGASRLVENRFLPETARVAGVELQPEHVKALMELCMDDLVDGFDYVGWRFSGSTDTRELVREFFENGAVASENMPEREKYDARRDPNDPAPHVLIKDGIQALAMKGRGIIVEVNPGHDLDNRYYDWGKLTPLAKAPKNFDKASVPPGGQLMFYSVKFGRHAEPHVDIDLNAWIRVGVNGEVSSGWIRHSQLAYRAHDITKHVPGLKSVLGGADRNPDFVWSPRWKPGVMEGAPWIGFSSINPFVDMNEVWKLWVESTSPSPEQAEQRILEAKAKWPERFVEHERLKVAQQPEIARLRADLQHGEPRLIDPQLLMRLNRFGEGTFFK